MDDSKATRDEYSDTNAKANEFLFRRVELEDAVTAHAAALFKASEIEFGKYVISAPSPFTKDDLARLRCDPAGVVVEKYGNFRDVYAARGFRMFPDIERVYVSRRAEDELGWTPRYDFGVVLDQIKRGEQIGSELARQVGIKAYHTQLFDDGPYPVEWLLQV